MANSRVRKRDKIKRRGRRQIEKLIAKGKSSWMSINEVLKDGRWKDPKDKDED